MKFINDEEIAQHLDYAELIDRLYEMFRSDYKMPLRHHHFYPVSNHQENTLILMPSWNEQYMGIKQIILAPGNQVKGLSTVSALYTLFDVETGQPLIMMDAREITSRRTACASALAARYLARRDVRHLLIVGGGKVAKHLAQAHTCVRDYEKISVWMRDQEKLAEFVAGLAAAGVTAQPVMDLEVAVRGADVISTSTMSPNPVVRGEWLKPGSHLDLIGSHKPDTRETDDEAIRRSSVFVDSMEALHETGDLALPVRDGILTNKDVKATLTDLCFQKHPGRQSDEENTLFKSAGLAIEDLAAALMVYQHVQQ